MIEIWNSWATSLVGQLLLFAEGEAAPAAGAGQRTTSLMDFFPLIMIGVLGYFLLIRPQSQQAAKLRQQINELKSGDKVVTKSGIYGTVMNVDQQKNRMTLKIDESNNTKIDIVLTSIDYVIDEKAKETGS
jgi:preprotein translocase subunit YajC